MKNTMVIYSFFLLILFDFFHLQAMDVGCGRLVVDGITSHIEPLYTLFTDQEEEKSYHEMTSESLKPGVQVFLWYVKNAQLPLMQITTGAIASFLFPSQKLFPLSIPYMWYWGTYGLYKQAQNIDTNLRIYLSKKDQEEDKSSWGKWENFNKKYVRLLSLNTIGRNALIFSITTALCYGAQCSSPELFKIIQPMAVGSAFAPLRLVGNGSGVDIVDQIISFSQAKQRVLVTAIILAALGYKPKNNDYFYFKNIWLYITLDTMQFGLRYVQHHLNQEKIGLELSYETLKKEEDVEKVEARLFMLNVFFKAVPVVVTGGHVLWNR